jgi:hypothetical protein
VGITEMFYLCSVRNKPQQSKTNKMTLSQEYQSLKNIATPQVIKYVFTNLDGYKKERETTSYETFMNAILGFGTRK